jgi:esterase/lipase superfamily enzyme
MAIDLKHYVVTTRKVKIIDDIWKYDPDHPDESVRYMRYGRYSEDGDSAVFINPIDAEGNNEDHHYKFSVKELSEDKLEAGYASRLFFDQLFGELEISGKGLLIFLHGISVKEKKEHQHVRLLHDKYINDSPSLGRLLMVTWPSQGFSVTQYPEEKKVDSLRTGKALGLFFLKLATEIQRRKANHLFVPDIYFMPQSMGHRVVNQMMNLLKYQKEEIYDRVKSLFEKIILMSPDMPARSLRQAISNKYDYKYIHELAKNTCIFYTKEDWVLKKAEQLHDEEVLGYTGPKEHPSFIISYRINQINAPKLMVDLKRTKAHRYFQYHSLVIDEINKLFAGEKPSEDIFLEINWKDHE